MLIWRRTGTYVIGILHAISDLLRTHSRPAHASRYYVDLVAADINSPWAIWGSNLPTPNEVGADPPAAMAIEAENALASKELGSVVPIPSCLDIPVTYV